MDARPRDRIAKVLAALRRIAAMVAGGVPADRVYAAVAAEAGRLLGADITSVGRYDPGGVVTVVGGWSSTGAAMPSAIGGETSLGGRNLATLAFQSGRPVRIDDYRDATGAAADVGRAWGYRSAVGAPITVEGRLWGFMSVASTRDELLPADTEARLADFSELAGTAIANAQARVELRGYAEEQAALRRVATLVARAVPPEEVFATVAAAAGRLFGTDMTAVSRYEPGGDTTVLGAWSSTGTAVTVGTRASLGGQNMTTLLFQTGRPVRVHYDEATGVAGDVGRDWGFRAAVGAPITVEGRLWGVLAVGTTGEEPIPADTEERLAGFTELIGTAVANAEAHAALAASRARVVAAADEARRRIERDLHDGAQQRLVTLALRLRELQAAPPEAGELARRLDSLAAGLDAALQELREIAGGIYPAVLVEGGLGPALRTLVRRCPIPVDLHVQVPDRPPYPVEIAAYYVVSEALTNTAKHSGASAADVEVVVAGGALRVRVSDNGRGGANTSHGSGLIGLKDRVEAQGGTITLRSPPGEGTTVDVRVPVGPGRPPSAA